MTRAEIEKRFNFMFERHQWREGEILNMIDFAESCVETMKEQLALHSVMCSCCGKKQPEVCGSCVSDIAQETGDAAYNSRR